MAQAEGGLVFSRSIVQETGTGTQLRSLRSLCPLRGPSSKHQTIDGHSAPPAVFCRDGRTVALQKRVGLAQTLGQIHRARVDEEVASRMGLLHTLQVPLPL